MAEPRDTPLPREAVETGNKALLGALEDEYASLGRQLARRGIDIEAVLVRLASFAVALPSWGVGRGGTRFARFPLPGEPSTIWEKLEDCAVIHQLCRISPRVSLHFPWDAIDDPAALRAYAEAYGLGFDAVNSNTFQDNAGQALSYASGSLAAADPAVRAQAVAHNIDCIRIGEVLGAKALTIWIGDGSNLPGQQDFTASFDRYLESSAAIVAALPEDWRILIEYKPFEPALYSTVVADWGSAYIAAQHLGEKAFCLVDLGHHLPGTNIEQIVARLRRFGKLGGFHFNDRFYGDDDLDAGSIDPHRLFLVFHELSSEFASGAPPSFMIDQSHNVTDPIESLLVSTEALICAQAKALLVDREELRSAQEQGDALLAMRLLRQGFATDVSPLTAMLRLKAGGAVDPVEAFRASDWRAGTRLRRRQVAGGAGIVA